MRLAALSPRESGRLFSRPGSGARPKGAEALTRTAPAVDPSVGGAAKGGGRIRETANEAARPRPIDARFNFGVNFRPRGCLLSRPVNHAPGDNCTEDGGCLYFSPFAAGAVCAGVCGFADCGGGWGDEGLVKYLNLSIGGIIYVRNYYI